MKTIAITLAASLIASTSAFANGGTLFDVNDAPHHFSAEQVRMLDSEPTASIAIAPRASNQGKVLSQKERHPALFDIDD